MTRSTLLATVLTASVAFGGVAYAADQLVPAPTPKETTAEKDAGKLSADGANAFRDLHLARVAIFDADPAKAKTLVGQAQTALGKAKTDESVFTKAEADLKPSAATKAKAGTDKAGMAKSDMTKPDMAKPDMPKSGSGDTTKAVAWLPIDGQLTLGEDFVATPQKAAAVSDANKTLAKGDRKGAIDTLKVAGVDVNFTMAVVPLDKTTTEVDQAAKLLDQGKYYEANAALKQVEDGMRFDVVDATVLPQPKAATKDGGKDAAGATGAPKPATH